MADLVSSARSGGLVGSARGETGRGGERNVKVEGSPTWLREVKQGQRLKNASERSSSKQRSQSSLN
jgi:hypothetical protein